MVDVILLFFFFFFFLYTLQPYDSNLLWLIFYVQFIDYALMYNSISLLRWAEK